MKPLPETLRRQRRNACGRRKRRMRRNAQKGRRITTISSDMKNEKAIITIAKRVPVKRMKVMALPIVQSRDGST